MLAGSKLENYLTNKRTSELMVPTSQESHMKTKYGTAAGGSRGTMGKAPGNKMHTQATAGEYNKGPGPKYSSNLKSAGFGFKPTAQTKWGFK